MPLPNRNPKDYSPSLCFYPHNKVCLAESELSGSKWLSKIPWQNLGFQPGLPDPSTILLASAPQWLLDFLSIPQKTVQHQYLSCDFKSHEEGEVASN